MALFLAALCRSSTNLYCGEEAEDISDVESVDERDLSFFSISGEMPHSLFAAEEDHMPCRDYVSRSMSCSIDLAARQDAINWILKVSEFHRFRPVTVYLSVNYLDRFLSTIALPESKAAHWHNLKKHCAGAWPMQLLSVACLSAAAKMVETHVPLLLDLQIMSPKFLFEPRTVCRMELLLMTTLLWRMRAVTPFDFLAYFAAAIRIAGGTAAILSPTFFSRLADLILSTHRVIDFLRFSPSAIAAAAVLCAASEAANSPATFDASFISCFQDLISMEKVSECRRLMEDFLLDNCQTATGQKTASPEERPLSPIGVLDAAACGSCDTQRSSAAFIPNPDSSFTDSPPAKRRRIPDSQCTGRMAAMGAESKIS